MEPLPVSQCNYECSSGQVWVRSIDYEEFLFKFFDPAIKEEREVKKIKDDQIFAKASTTQKVIKFTSLKHKSLKEASQGQVLEADTAVYVGPPHSQYGVIRKVLRPADGAL